MNRKIGLISYHRDPNYGTMLQAFALAYTIKKMGGNCEYLNYFEYKQPSTLKSLVSRIFRIIRKVYNIKRKDEYDFFNQKEFTPIMHKFKSFHEQYIPYSSKKYYVDNIKEAVDNYQYFIVGSDQTWSSEVNKLGTTINYLDFENKKEKKRSYAPSLGTVHLDDKYVDLLVSKLENFKFISCRERQNCECLNEKLSRAVEFVLDPTLLLQPSDWDKFVPTRVVEEEYILAYILGQRECISEFAEKLGRIYNIPVYYILTRPEMLHKRNVLRNIGPFDFINLIKYSKYVVTDSFHGTVFSINYERDFYSFAKRDGGIGKLDNDRIAVLLEEFNLTERFITNEELIDYPSIDYTDIKSKLAVLRMKSIQYLKNIIE